MTYAGNRVIIDADSHVIELDDFLHNYADPADRAIRVDVALTVVLARRGAHRGIDLNRGSVADDVGVRAAALRDPE